MCYAVACMCHARLASYHPIVCWRGCSPASCTLAKAECVHPFHRGGCEQALQPLHAPGRLAQHIWACLDVCWLALLRRDLFNDIAMPGGIANKSFVREWDAFCKAMDSNDFMKLPAHSALALKLLSKCVQGPHATVLNPPFRAAVSQYPDATSMMSSLIVTDMRGMCRGCAPVIEDPEQPVDEQPADEKIPAGTEPQSAPSENGRKVSEKCMHLAHMWLF